MEISDQELYGWIHKVNVIFYDKVYEDPWLSKVFRNVEKDIIVKQQSDFMTGAMGGRKRYSGRSPKDAHPHIMINEEMWNLREKFLVEACEEAKAPPWLVEKWIRIDNSFKKSILKASIQDCKKRFFTDEIVDEPGPLKKRTG